VPVTKLNRRGRGNLQALKKSREKGGNGRWRGKTRHQDPSRRRGLGVYGQGGLKPHREIRAGRRKGEKAPNKNATTGD